MFVFVCKTMCQSSYFSSAQTASVVSFFRSSMAFSFSCGHFVQISLSHAGKSLQWAQVICFFSCAHFFARSLAPWFPLARKSLLGPGEYMLRGCASLKICMPFRSLFVLARQDPGSKRKEEKSSTIIEQADMTRCKKTLTTVSQCRLFLYA